jgi:hypothetical protein
VSLISCDDLFFGRLIVGRVSEIDEPRPGLRHQWDPPSDLRAWFSSVRFGHAPCQLLCPQPPAPHSRPAQPIRDREIDLCEHPVVGPDRGPPAIRHRIARVDYEIGQSAAQLRGIGCDRENILQRRILKRYVATHGALQQVHQGQPRSFLILTVSSLNAC